jgi:hypothetical protein
MITIMDDNDQNNIGIILRQTAYTQKEAEELYIKYGKDYIKVIKEYMEIKEKSPNDSNDSNRSLNQEIYKQIRDQMEVNTDHLYKKLQQ